MKKKVLIINQFSANKGDRAVLYALISEVLKHTDNITVSTSQPELWIDYKFYDENNIKFVPWGWDYINTDNRFKRFLVNKLKKISYILNREIFLSESKMFNWLSSLLTNSKYDKALKESDLVISTGGHHITTILVKDAITGQIFDLSRAISENKPVILWSQTIGPLDFHNKQNEKFVNKIIKSINQIYIRDIKTIELIDNLVDNKNYSQTFESVFTLNHKFDFILPSQREKKVGISIYSTKIRKEKEAQQYINSLASLAKFAIKQGYKIEFFPMEMNGNPADDRKMIQRIVKIIDDSKKCIVHNDDLDTLTHMKKVSECQIFVGHKTHSIIFSLTVGTPLLAIAYHVKTNDFMDQFDLAENCISDEQINNESLINLFNSISKNIDVIGNKQYSTSKKFANQISYDLASIFE